MIGSTSLLRRAAKPGVLPSNQQAMASPPISRSRSSSVDSFDEDYFSKTYVPLSNLPTPPLSSHSHASSRQQSPEVLFSPTEYLDPTFLGPAVHLTNLIPTSISLTTPSIQHVHAILTRSQLPLSTIALSVAILDSLSSRFALTYRRSLPLSATQHIDSIHPELLPLSALILAVKFLDDEQRSTRLYMRDWGRDLWTCEQINVAQWCLLEGVGGRLLSLWEEGVIQAALEDMVRAGRASNGGRKYSASLSIDTRARGMSDGHAIVGADRELTPAETPVLTPQEEGGMCQEIQEQSRFQLMERNVEEPFPTYVDPLNGS